ncbi:MAG: inosine monophosphate cyclohydrolase [Anaerolineae bacterium]|nr:inosine monophosphate cyclohydrolase [Anaerolineae bacterium]
MNAMQIASRNFERHIRQNSYPGRGLVVGRSSVEDAWLQIYWIMGRSQHSRNRRFVVDGSSMRTEPVDVSLVKDPSLIIYNAMLELPGIYLATNGDQTDTLVETLQAEGTFDDALGTREREPDPPNYTARISAMLDLNKQPVEIALSILKGNTVNPELTDRFTFRPATPPPGLGYCITTYQGDGKPLPPFAGDPLPMPCEGSAEEVLAAYWDALDAENRVSLAVKTIPAQGGPGKIIVQNRFS